MQHIVVTALVVAASMLSVYIVVGLAYRLGKNRPPVSASRASAVASLTVAAVAGAIGANGVGAADTYRYLLGGWLTAVLASAIHQPLGQWFFASMAPWPLFSGSTSRVMMAHGVARMVAVEGVFGMVGGGAAFLSISMPAVAILGAALGAILTALLVRVQASLPSASGVRLPRSG